MSRCPQVRLAGWQEDVALFFAAMDMLVLPTYREGLPTVLLEAAAMEIPTITTDATGARNALVPGVTGLQVPMRDAGSLGTAIATLIDDAAKRRPDGPGGTDVGHGAVRATPGLGTLRRCVSGAAAT